MKKVLAAFALVAFFGINSATAQTESIVKVAVVTEVRASGPWQDASGHFDGWNGEVINPGNGNGNANAANGNKTASFVVAVVSGTGEVISGIVMGEAVVGDAVRSINDSKKSLLSLIR